MGARGEAEREVRLQAGAAGRGQLTQALRASLTWGGQEPGRGWPALCWEGGPPWVGGGCCGRPALPLRPGNWCCERPRPSETQRRAGAAGGISGCVAGSGQAVFWTLEPTAAPWRPSSAEATLGTASRQVPGPADPLSQAVSPQKQRTLPPAWWTCVSGFRFRGG